MAAKRFLQARGEPLKDPPWNRFFEFIAPDADRYNMLTSMIDTMGLNSAVFPIAGNRHFFIFPRGRIIKPGESGLPFRRQSPVVLASHYDRVPGSSGANDNSAAVMQLLRAALRLTEQGTDYWIIIFTDKEELASGESFKDQGSYSLAEYLRLAGLADARIFIFDACGAGDTMIVSSTTDHLLKGERSRGILKARQLVTGLRNLALDTVRYLNLDKVLRLPTPFSDDAGFLKAGLPAQTITMLPAGEAASWASVLRKRPELIDFLLSGALQNTPDRLLIPETWRNLNGPADSHLQLTPEHYDRVIRFASALCAS
jgi:hypothetical protein